MSRAQPDASPASPILGSATPKVFLIRHADASEGEKDRERGRHLTEIGRRQAAALAQRVARWQLDVILCSDKYRSIETAEAIRKHHPEIECIVDPLFREASRGTIERLLDAPDGALRARLEAVWQKVVSMPHAVSAIVTHNGLIKYLISRVLRYEGDPRPSMNSAFTGITALAVRPKGRASIQFFNDTAHLTPDLVAGPKRPWIEDPVSGRWHF